MLLKKKANVDLKGLQIEMREVMKTVLQVYKRYGYEPVVTSALDGVHGWGSYHYSGYALDFRTRMFVSNKSLDLVVLAIKKDLRKIDRRYVVIKESNHLHIHFKADKKEYF